MRDKNSAEDTSETCFMDSAHIQTLFPCHAPLFLSLSLWFLSDPSVNAQIKSLDDFICFQHSTQVHPLRLPACRVSKLPVCRHHQELALK